MTAKPPKELSDPTSGSQLVEVLKIKEQANLKFKESDYFSAKCLYSGALELLERCCLHLDNADQIWEGIKNNMALCDLKRKEWTRVIETTTEILKRNPSNTKALYRRGVARIGHGKLEDAQGDLKAALAIEPGNADARQRLAEVLQQVRQQQSARREQASKMRGFLHGERLDDTVPITEDGSVRKLHGNEHAPLLSSWLKREWLSRSSGAAAVVTCHVVLRTQSGAEVWSSRRPPGHFDKQEAGPHMVHQAKPAERPVAPVRWVLEDAWQGVFFAWNAAVKTLQHRELGKFEVTKQTLAPSVEPAIERCVARWLGEESAALADMYRDVPEDIRVSARKNQALQILGLPGTLCMEAVADPEAVLAMEMELLDVSEYLDVDGDGTRLLRVLRESKPNAPRVAELCTVTAHFRVAKFLTGFALKDTRLGLANGAEGLVMQEDKTKQPMEFIVGEEDAADEGDFVPPCIGRCLLSLPGGTAEGSAFELVLRDGVPISEMEKSIFEAYATGAMNAQAMPDTSGPVAIRVEVERVVPAASGPGCPGWTGMASLREELARAGRLESLDEGRHKQKALRRWHRVLRWLEQTLEGHRGRHLEGREAVSAGGCMYDLEWDAEDGSGGGADAGPATAVGGDPARASGAGAGAEASSVAGSATGCAAPAGDRASSFTEEHLRQLEGEELEAWAAAHTAVARLLLAAASGEPARSDQAEWHARSAVQAAEAGSISKELHVEARMLLASRLTDIGRPAEALEVLNGAQLLDPTSGPLRDQIAKTMQQDGDRKAVGVKVDLRALKEEFVTELGAESNPPRLLELLQTLEGLPLTWDAVSESAVGKEVGRCARHADSAVAEKARAIVARFHKLAKEQRPLWVR